MKKMLKLFTLKASLLAMLLMSACHYSGPSYDRVQSFIDLLNSQYPYDSYFYLVKHPSQSATEGFVVVYSDDTGYVAYDIANYRVGDSWYSYSQSADFQEVYIDYTYSDSWGEVFYVGDAFYNDFWGGYAGEFVFERSQDAFKDLEKVAAIKESYKVSKLGESFVSDFGLSEQRANKVAKMVVQWEKLGKARQLTDADANAFSKEMIGVDIAKAEQAYKELLAGDDSEMKSLVGEAAKVNGTSPEHMNALINQFIGK